ncbi:uncharacterized protein LOC132041985 [Lycium ferocissimum]|uniref:uncharacterized protein LOC132041985 n=1 Tax=Lycium ferocissimum TaxID=112874 RepID=UPI002814AF57|nr:uncharacterized protein LOC132041985 [Lycium ferocissimum]
MTNSSDEDYVKKMNQDYFARKFRPRGDLQGKGALAKIFPGIGRSAKLPAAQSIAQINIGEQSGTDFPIWQLSEDGCFTNKSHSPHHMLGIMEAKKLMQVWEPKEDNHREDTLSWNLDHQIGARKQTFPPSETWPDGQRSATPYRKIKTLKSGGKSFGEMPPLARKMNMEAISLKKAAGIGGILRDCHGDLIMAFSITVQCNSNNVAEALARKSGKARARRKEEAAKEKEKQVGWEADCRIKIWETDRQNHLGLKTNKSAKQIFDEIFKDLDESSTKSCTMFKVNMWLRESNPDAYTPKLISIGPYHKKNPQLQSMEKYKLLYLQRFLQRRDEMDGESCIRELEKLKDEALKCYDNIEDLDTSDSSGIFLKMLLLDGCFVVEYIREFCHGAPKGEDKIINTDWMEGLVDRDFLLLENQLPFFILAKLHEMTKEGTESFITMVKINFSASLPKVNSKFISETDGNNAKEIKHLLQVIHMCYCPPKMENSRTSMKAKLSKKSSCWNPLQLGTTAS